MAFFNNFKALFCHVLRDFCQPAGFHIIRIDHICYRKIIDIPLTDISICVEILFQLLVGGIHRKIYELI